MKKQFYLAPLLIIFLCTIFQTPMNAQCAGTTQEPTYNITLFGYPELGQSWPGDCQGVLKSITVCSNSTAPVSNVTLRI